jgi:Uma2 family endonuclease
MVHQLTRPPVIRGKWIPMTWEEFLAWTSEGKSEWVDGEGIAYVSTSVRHARMVRFLAELLGIYVRAFDLGEIFVDTLLMRLRSRQSGRMPDIVIVRTEHLDRLRDKWLEGPADFLVEFVSEDDPDRDLVVKHTEFEREGVPEYLTIDARVDHHDVLLRQRGADGRFHLVQPDEQGRLHSSVLPGFWLDPAWFQLDPLPNPISILRRISPEAWRRLVAEVEAGEIG